PGAARDGAGGDRLTPRRAARRNRGTKPVPRPAVDGRRQPVTEGRTRDRRTDDRRRLTAPGTSLTARQAGDATDTPTDTYPHSRHPDRPNGRTHHPNRCNLDMA